MKARILLVDDNKLDLALNSAVLEAIGYECVTACSSAQAIKQLVHNKIDLVLLDLNMPVVDGIQFLEALKRTLMFRNTPVLMLSGVKCEAKSNTCDFLGADGYLQKPLDIQQHQAVINNVIRKTS